MFLGIAGIFTLPSVLRKGLVSKPWVAQIDGNSIWYDEFRNELVEKRDQLAAIRAQYGEYADVLFASMGINPNPQILAADSLIRGALVLQAGKAAGLELHSDFIAEQIKNKNREVLSLIPSYALDAQGNVDQNILREYLSRRGMTIAEFEQRLEQLLMRTMVSELIVASVHVPRFEVEQKAITSFAPKRFSALHFSLDSFVAEEKKKALNEQEVQDYYDRQNQQYKRYWVPEKRDATVWKFEPSDYGISVSDKQIAHYYDDYKTRDFVKEPAKIQVRRIFFRVTDPSKLQATFEKAKEVHKQVVADPASFGKIAKEISQDETSAKNGGLVPFFARGELNPSFEKAAFLLKEEGEISSIIQTEEGFDIIQRGDRKKAIYKPLKDVETDIKKSLTQKEFARLFAQDVKQLTNQAKAESASLDAFIAEKGGKKQVVHGAVKDDTVRTKTIFSLKKDALGSYLDDGAGYIVLAGSIEKSHVAPFEEVKGAVKTDLYTERAIQTIKEQMTQAQELAKTTPLASLKGQFNARLETVPFVDPSDEDAVKALKEKGLPSYRMLTLERVGGVIAGQTPEGGVIVRLDEIKQIDKEKLEEKMKEARANLEAERYQLTVEGFIASSYRNATIKMNETLLGIA
jgi:parvulin-like peptidyl-prolyl isomerase